MNEQLTQIAKSVSDLVSSEGGARPKFSYNGLATPPVKAIKSLWGLFGRLDVPPGTWGICFEPHIAPQILEPGTHWLSGMQAASTLVQFVDASRRRHPLPPVSGVSLDGWNITLQVVLIYEVTDPLEIARAVEPIATLEATGQAAILAQIETMPHEALLGTVDTPNAVQQAHRDPVEGKPAAQPAEVAPGDEPGDSLPAPASPAEEDSLQPGGRGLDAFEKALLARLNNRPALSGMRVVDIAVVDRQGDQRLVELLQGEALARLEATQGQQTEAARAELDKMRLEMQVQTAQAERAVSLIQAETQAQLATIQEQMRLLEARTQAEVQEIHQAQEAREAERKRIAEEWRTAKELDLRSMEYQHEEALAVIQGTTEITAEAARHGILGSLQGNTRRIEAAGDGGEDVVGVGLKVMRSFREKIAPPATHFLPRPSGAGYQVGAERIQAESLRLSRIEGMEHELVIRHGEIFGLHAWFTQDGPPALAEVRIDITCPKSYPLGAPQARILAGEEVREYVPGNWAPELYLADVVREILLALLSQPGTGGSSEAEESEA